MDYQNPNDSLCTHVDHGRWGQNTGGNQGPGQQGYQDTGAGGGQGRGSGNGQNGGISGSWDNGRDGGWNGSENSGWNGNQNGGAGGSWRAGTGPYLNPDYEKRALKETRRCFSRVGIVYLTYLAAATLSQLAVMMALLWTGAAGLLSDELYLLAGILGMYPVAVPLTALFVKWVPKRGNVGQESWSFGKLCGCFIVAMGVLYTGNIIGNILMAVAGSIKGETIANELDSLIMSMDPWTIIVAVVVAAPVMEELVFRKFLLDRIAGYGYWTSMLVSGFLFGVAHGNFYQFFYAFGLGMVFSYIYLCTGKLVYTIGFHMLINFWGSIMPLGLLKIIEKNMVAGGMLALGNVMLMLGFIICGIILLVVCRKDIVFLPAGDGLGGGKRTAAVLGNFGMILFLIGGIAFFAFSF